MKVRSDAGSSPFKGEAKRGMGLSVDCTHAAAGRVREYELILSRLSEVANYTATNESIDKLPVRMYLPAVRQQICAWRCV